MQGVPIPSRNMGLLILIDDGRSKLMEFIPYQV